MTTYILIDYENVQPKTLEALPVNGIKIIAFIGALQTTLPFAFVDAMHKRGRAARYVKMTKSGPNALDFLLVSYIGKISALDPSAQFVIMSNDKGYDSLITHFRNKQNMTIHRVGTLPKANEKPKPTAQPKPNPKFQKVVKTLKIKNGSKPKTVTTLGNLIDNIFPKPIKEAERNNIIGRLKNKKYIHITDNKVSYSLPR